MPLVVLGNCRTGITAATGKPMRSLITRAGTLETARSLQKTAEGVVGRVPFVLVLNKIDLVTEWQVDERALWKVADEGWPIVKASAKSGVGVEEAFGRLARRIVER